jgi:hypothetical protein
VTHSGDFSIEYFNGKIIEMSLKLTKKNNYILIELSKGMDYWEILEAISELFSMPESKNDNDIWAFRSGQMKISYADLYEIKNLAQKICPKDFKSTKTAIVVDNGTQQSLATFYSDICKDLPRMIRVFSDFPSAKDWIIT